MPRRKRRGFGRIAKWKGRWCARWLDENGVLRQKSFRGSRALAERFLALKGLEMEEQAAQGGRAIERIRFRDMLDRYEEIFAGQKSATTIYREHQYLQNKAREYFGGQWMDEILRADIERWLIHRVRTDKISGATRSRLLTVMSAFFKKAASLGYCRHNPCAGITRQKEALRPVPFLDVATQQRLIDATDGMLRAFVTLLLDTGLRAGEALRLRWREVDFDRQVITVRISKTKTPREVGFTSRGNRGLIELRNLGGGEAPDAGDLLFGPITTKNGAGEPQLQNAARKRFKAAAKSLGWPELRVHDLRHVFATTAVRAGVPLGELQQLLGHRTPAMTMRYARHCPANSAERARDRLLVYVARMGAG